MSLNTQGTLPDYVLALDPVQVFYRSIDYVSQTAAFLRVTVKQNPFPPMTIARIRVAEYDDKGSLFSLDDSILLQEGLKQEINLTSS